MWEPRSKAFDRALAHVSTPVVYALPMFGGEVIGPPSALPIVEGFVTVDGQAAIRRAGQWVIRDDNDVLRQISRESLINPYGGEILVRCGVQFDDGTVETVPVGLFRITSIKTRGRGYVFVVGKDRSSTAARARFIRPYTIKSGTNTVKAAIALLDSRYPNLTYIYEETGHTTPLTTFEEGGEDGPFTAFRGILSADGLEGFFDQIGRVVIRRIVDPTEDDVVWTHRPSPDNLLIEAEREVESESARNAAIAIGESPTGEPTVRWYSDITNQDHPLHPDNFGFAPVFMRSPMIRTIDQARDAARGLLLRRAAGAEHIRFTAASHPAHDAGDVVAVASDEAAIDAVTALESFSFDVLLKEPATYETMTRRHLP